jgi:hypothetical protein
MSYSALLWFKDGERMVISAADRGELEARLAGRTFVRCTIYYKGLKVSERYGKSAHLLQTEGSR